ncbi:metalloendopeptidase OMA1, mitochondrial-like isoform X1 [Strongylocentrotus purpuratus]|uniref:Metalloendopeptidase OMA1, mitochondrial n=2 Tax=Strongylocentrotus purpuratus TaxID=7668 RepID=A0A7M7PK93_STRPU|nr:metalloendopeptidase OMA1, mitochondrial-like isoform X1 [Strongylocentrotus purpuratus]
MQMMAQYIAGLCHRGGFPFSRVLHCSLLSRINPHVSSASHRSFVMHPCAGTLTQTNLSVWKKARTTSCTNQSLESNEKLHLIHHRIFHTSQSRPAVPVAVWLAAKTLAKTAAIITGRTLRNRWRDHPKHKHKTASERLHDNRGKIIAGILGMLGFGIGYYYYHIEYTPLTNRPRFILFNKTQFEKIVEEEYKMHCETYKDSFVPTDHKIYGIISGIVMQLIKANQDVSQIRNQTWTIHVVDQNIKNAFVLPNGHIFVFTGILQATDNIEQLGTVLAHEMAHVVLNHSAEMASFFEFFDLFMIVVLTVLWAFLPNDGVALVATWFKQKVVELLLHMPYSRSLETEADEVGLMLAAKSCIDVRECKAFWEAMDVAQISTGEPEPLEFLSTHPSHQRRADYIESLLPKAIQVRQYCNCPELPHRIPSQRAVITKSIPAVSAA